MLRSDVSFHYILKNFLTWVVLPENKCNEHMGVAIHAKTSTAFRHVSRCISMKTSVAYCTGQNNEVQQAVYLYSKYPLILT